MHELGQPMHAFDLDELAGGRIIVRRAKDGETITTLDEVDRTLNESMLAICDGERPAAVGVIMGGLASGISGKTVNVLLEVAYFKRENIRATSRKLNLATEASYRFERGVDVENLVNASTALLSLFAIWPVAPRAILSTSIRKRIPLIPSNRMIFPAQWDARRD